MALFGYSSPHSRPAEIQEYMRTCAILADKKTKGELGSEIATIVLAYTPSDLDQMKGNFSGKIREFNKEYRENLEETMTTFLHGTFQQVRLMDQQGVFASMQDEVCSEAHAYWKMVALQCGMGENNTGSRLRFLKFLLSGFCMFVLDVPGHPVGMLFPGGDRVEVIEGRYYCPVRIKANDVDAALCPFCPAEQTPEIGYLKPPVNASVHRKQEFIKDCYEHHHFNG